ncbi:hypothetical protein C5167_047410 [Papaver somniferum]|uniref:Kinesin motor domain-containing protein n=1 Tax=Papaver somniferum TaxID=3469 RepID=A0A4Y7LK56_PAPSO|nr:hypothetical protein C5167_047410 [Papaver somniferum]
MTSRIVHSSIREINCSQHGNILLSSGYLHKFAFDRVFDPKAKQEDIFVDVSELVQSALDGKKVCIFAYGQTGSGKTYTMIGGLDQKDKEEKGIIPRSVEQIFQYFQSVTVLEIYKEQIHDLLDPKSGEQKKYIISHGKDGKAVVPHLTEEDISGPEQFISFLKQMCTEHTLMNEQSSRSHLVLTLNISRVTESSQVHGFLNMIDLAGNENLKESGAIGDRAEEAKAINKSLSAFTGVIQALVQKNTQYPTENHYLHTFSSLVSRGTQKL